MCREKEEAVAHIRECRIAAISWTQKSLTFTCFPGKNIIFFPHHRERLLEYEKNTRIYFNLMFVFNFHRLGRFSESAFPMSSSGFPTLFLPISFQLSFLSVTRIAFSQFVASYFNRVIYNRCHIPSFPLSSTVSLLPSSKLYTNSCRIFPIWYY